MTNNGRRQIQVLSDLVANKIAAGEVIERPASVMKELVENALDAGARHITVEIAAGGKKLVAVSDDGCGMGRDDALLCIERHATSKIREVQDIERIATLGFRGEALAAIAAVSQFTLITRATGVEAGTEVTVQGGKIADVRETGCPVGTRIEVRNLFFNVPARRKFLRTEATEMAFLKQMFLVFALSQPKVGFELIVDGRKAQELAGDAHLDIRIGELFGRDYLKSLRPLDARRETLRVSGYAGLPSMTRADRNEQFVCVNGRASSAPLVAFAIQEAYRDLVPRGRFPALFLFIHVDPGQVDVNVHPTKKEVRFRNPSEIRDLLIAGVRKALALPSLETASAEKESVPSPLPFSMPSRQQQFPYPRKPSSSAPGPGAFPPTASGLPVTSGLPSTPAANEPWADSRILGVIGGLYMALESADGLVLMDIQAAHERVLYERMMAGVDQGRVERQTLLAPATVELRPDDARRVRENLETLRKMGFGIADFGGDAFLVDMLPACLSMRETAGLLTDIAREIEEGGSLHTLEERVARAASQAAVRGSDPLTDAELKQLAKDLAQTEMPYTCPYGRPTVMLTSFAELARKFGRS